MCPLKLLLSVRLSSSATDCPQSRFESNSASVGLSNCAGIQPRNGFHPRTWPWTTRYARSSAGIPSVQGSVLPREPCVTGRIRERSGLMPHVGVRRLRNSFVSPHRRLAASREITSAHTSRTQRTRRPLGEHRLQYSQSRPEMTAMFAVAAACR